VLINRMRGFKAFCTLFINFAVLAVAVYLMCWGVNPVAVALVFSLGASAFILFFLNGVNRKTVAAYVSVVVVLALTAAFIIFIGTRGKLGGFEIAYEEIILVYSPDIAVNYMHVAIAVVLMSLTGAVTDTALDITTSLNEVYENNRGMGFAELLQSGRRIGGDILGTMINTLLFVFFGEFMGFFILYDFPGFNINGTMLFQELAKLLAGNIGCVLIIPVAIVIQSWWYGRRRTTPTV